MIRLIPSLSLSQKQLLRFFLQLVMTFMIMCCLENTNACISIRLHLFLYKKANKESNEYGNELPTYVEYLSKHEWLRTFVSEMTYTVIMR